MKTFNARDVVFVRLYCTHKPAQATYLRRMYQKDVEKGYGDGHIVRLEENPCVYEKYDDDRGVESLRAGDVVWISDSLIGRTQDEVENE